MAPLPSLITLIKAIFLPFKDVDRSAWLSFGDDSYWVSSSSWSLYLLAELCRTMKGKRHLTIFLPDYMCNMALGKLRTSKVQLIFYPITFSLMINEPKFLSLAYRHSPDMIVFVHYFGEENKANFLKDYCSDNSVWLVEDATHCIRKIKGIGTYGDFIMYSPHKHFALPDGALLVASKNGPNKLQGNIELKEIINKNQEKIRKQYVSNQVMLWLLKRLLQKIGLVFYLPKNSDHSTWDTNSDKKDFYQSIISRKLIFYEARDINRYIEHREYIKNYLANIFKSIYSENEIEIVSHLSKGYYLVVRCLITESYPKIYNDIKNSGIPILKWPDLPPEVLNNPSDASLAIAFCNSHLFIPTHQSIKKRCLNRSFRKIIFQRLMNWSLSEINYHQWDKFISDIREPVSITQSWGYGDSKIKAGGKKIKRYAVYDDNNDAVAIVQISLQNVIFDFFGFARINRGPIMLIRNARKVSLADSLMSIACISRVKFGYNFLVLLFAPKYFDETFINDFLKIVGLYKIPIENYKTAVLCLDKSKEDLFLNLDPKWRNLLRKALKNNLVIFNEALTWDGVTQILSEYENYQEKKSFVGLPSSLIRGFADNNCINFQFSIFRAYFGNSPIGSLVTLSSAGTATYLIGMTNELGRLKQANTLLLWYAIIAAKNNQNTWFDLGGLNTNHISHFKKGINGQIYEFPGEWVRIA